jgi:hypothetical protein
MIVELLLAAAVSAAPTCPAVTVHRETSTLVQMGAGGRADARAYRAVISDPKVSCDPAGSDLKVHLTFQVKADLAPGVEARAVKAPYFVVVMNQGKIVAKEVFPVSLGFSAAATTLNLTETVDKISLPVRIGGYEILVGFQLTPEQLRAAQN